MLPTLIHKVDNQIIAFVNQCKWDIQNTEHTNTRIVNSDNCNTCMHYAARFIEVIYMDVSTSVHSATSLEISSANRCYVIKYKIMQKVCVLVQSPFFPRKTLKYFPVTICFNLFVLFSLLVLFRKKLVFLFLKGTKDSKLFRYYLEVRSSQNQTNKLKLREYLLVVNKKLIQ